MYQLSPKGKELLQIPLDAFSPCFPLNHIWFGSVGSFFVALDLHMQKMRHVLELLCTLLIYSTGVMKEQKCLILDFPRFGDNPNKVILITIELCHVTQVLS